MANYTFKNNSKFGITPVPNIFIDEYMPSADGNFVKVYIAGLMESLYNETLSGEYLSRKLGLLESDIIKALEYWESKGLIAVEKYDGGTAIEFLWFRGSGAAVNTNHCDMYSPENIHTRLGSPMLRDMFDNIEKLLGRVLSPNEIAMYLSWIDDYRFTPEVIELLLTYCKSKGKVEARYIQKVALGWHDSNITSVGDAQKYIARFEEKHNNYRLVLDFLGLKENELMKPQQDFLDKWFNSWNFSMEMILEACKICSLRINEPNFSYIDGILSNWNKNGIKKIEDVEKTDSKKKSKGVKYKAPVTTFNSYDQRSYDIKDLEKRLLGRSEEENNEQ